MNASIAVSGNGNNGAIERVIDERSGKSATDMKRSPQGSATNRATCGARSSSAQTPPIASDGQAAKAPIQRLARTEPILITRNGAQNGPEMKPEIMGKKQVLVLNAASNLHWPGPFVG